MKKSLLVFLLSIFSVISLQAKADIYLATGVLTGKKDTDAARVQLEIALRKSSPEIYGSEPFKSAYNTTSGFWDFIEAGSQLFAQNGWSMYWNSFIDLTNRALTQHYRNYFENVSKNHGIDLSLQKENYKASINAGNQVIVIAHSQGNYFTNEAYDSLSECQKKSFYMLGVANPASEVSGMDEGRGALATLDNDPITYVPSSMSPNVINDERFIIGGTDLELMKFHEFNYYRTQNSVTKSKIDTFAEYAIQHFNGSNPDVSAPIHGAVDIKLSWASPDILMELSSELGTKADATTGCSTLEHYYVENKEDIVPGIYAVDVSHIGTMGDPKPPYNVSLNIHTPGAVSVFDFNITSLDMLNLGHVADINITEEKIAEITAVNTGVGYTTIKCYGVCGNSTTPSGTYKDYLYSIQSKLKQAMLGPLSEAGITLTQAEDFENSLSFYESSTSGGSSILTSGVFYFTQDALSILEDDSFYVLSVNGGNDIDANDDGVVDATSTPNLGSIHGVVDEKTLQNENFKVNILTEVAFQLTKELMTDELNATILQEKLDDIATRLLKEDVNYDTKIDYKDILAWQPIHDKAKLLKPYDEFYEPVVQKIYKDEDIYEEAYDLAYKPHLKITMFNVDENATIDTNIGKLELSLVNGKVSYSLDEDNDLFDITVDGNISLKREALNYEGVTSYTVSIDAEVDGEHYSTEVRILVNNILELPVLKEVDISINENIAPLSKIGKIPILSSDGIGEIVLEGEGSELFNIDKYGTMSVVQNASFDYNIKKGYSLKAYAVNQLGESAKVSINILLINRILGVIDTSGSAYGVSLSSDGMTAFIADGKSGLQIVDISNPETPVIIGSVDTPDFAIKVVLSLNEEIAFVADQFSGLQIIDISDTKNPFILSSIYTKGLALDLVLSLDGTKLFLANVSNLEIIDVSSPLTPFTIGSVSTEVRRVCLSSDETKAFTLGFGELHIIDISNPIALVEIASFDNLDSGNGVAISKDETKIFIADGSAGLQIIDISNLNSLTVAGTIDTPGYARKIVLSRDESKVFIADGKSGVQVIDIINPVFPVIIYSVDLLGDVNDIILSKDETKLYVVDGDAGLQIIDITGL